MFSRVLKQTRFGLEIVSVIYNRFKKDYCSALFVIFFFYILVDKLFSIFPQT